MMAKGSIGKQPQPTAQQGGQQAAGTGDPFLDQLTQTFAAGMSEGGGSALEPIGGYVSPDINPELTPAYGLVGDPIGEPELDRAYYEGDEYAILQGMNTEQLARFQDTLVANGLVRDVIPGRIDDSTIKGMASLMALGNREGATWSSVLNGIVRAGGTSGSATAEDFDPQPYLQPDYAALAQDVKQTFRRRLGREPDQYEMQQLTGELTGFYAQEHEAQQELRRLAFEQGTTPGTQPAGAVSGVDPIARFNELFDRKYANEIEFVEDKERAQVSRAVVQSGVDTLSQMSGGN